MKNPFNELGNDHPGIRFLNGFLIFILLLIIAYLLGYILIPEGALKDFPILVNFSINDSLSNAELILRTFAYNFLFTLLVITMNLFRVRRFPFGFLPFFANVFLLGLFAGSNSFSGEISSRNLEGLLYFFLIGFLEFMAYLLAASATASIHVYYSEKWRGEQFNKIRSLRDLRISRTEALMLVLALILLLVASINEWWLTIPA